MSIQKTTKNPQSILRVEFLMQLLIIGFHGLCYQTLGLSKWLKNSKSLRLEYQRILIYELDLMMWKYSFLHLLFHFDWKKKNNEALKWYADSKASESLQSIEPVECIISLYKFWTWAEFAQKSGASPLFTSSQCPSVINWAQNLLWVMENTLRFLWSKYMALLVYGIKTSSYKCLVFQLEQHHPHPVAPKEDCVN
jgi:hypothetical protein